MTDREAFEAHMRRLNACVHLGRQKIDETYRTISVERNWQLWQEAVKHGREQVAAEARAWLGGVGACTGAKYVGDGTVVLTFTKLAAPSTLAPHP